MEVIIVLNVSPLQGDGGSPLMCRNPDGSFTQAGIVAWGIECNLPDVPGGYVNIASFVCWIKQIVEEVRAPTRPVLIQDCCRWRERTTCHTLKNVRTGILFFVMNICVHKYILILNKT